jgi:hypothetical protein
MFSRILFSAILAAGFSGAALASNGDSNIDALMARQPHSAAVSQGIATVVGNEEGGPVIRYSGAARGNLSRGLPVIVGNSGGDPVIVYR